MTGGMVVCSRDKGIADHIIPDIKGVQVLWRRWEETRAPLADQGMAHDQMELPPVMGRAFHQDKAAMRC